MLDWDKMDKADYDRLMLKTNVLHQNNNPKNTNPKKQ